MLTREDSQPKYEWIINIGLVETKHINNSRNKDKSPFVGEATSDADNICMWYLAILVDITG